MPVMQVFRSKAVDCDCRQMRAGEDGEKDDQGRWGESLALMELSDLIADLQSERQGLRS